MAGPRHPVIVLAGGKSTRLGRDKASEVLEGRTLLQRAIDAVEGLAASLVIVKAGGQHLPGLRSFAPISTVEDAYANAGPLGGIYTGLLALRSSGPETPLQGPLAALVVACDMPLLQPVLLRELLHLIPGHDAVVPVREGLPEPLCAVYTTACAEPARRLLDQGAYKLAGLLEHVDTLLVPEDRWRALDPEGLSFLNVNREADLEYARLVISRRANRC
jgi:molybdopterin-guanine dinucleotide biosynthesis protein A